MLGRVQALVFDGTQPTPELNSAIAEADYVLVSVPPGENGDPVLAAFGDASVCMPRMCVRSFISRPSASMATAAANGSTRTTQPQPDLGRGSARLAAERDWQSLGQRNGAGVAVLRLAGIYGPGQNALEQIARGKARRIVKPGQIFNRIHVADIAQAIDAAFTRHASGDFQRRRRRAVAARRSDRLCRAAF